MAGKQTFDTVLVKADDCDATWIDLPFDIEMVWGAKRVPVRAEINGVEYRGMTMRMGGEFYVLGIPKAIRDAAGIKAGDHIEITIERDDQPRVITPPDDLLSALENADLGDAWGELSYTKQKEAARGVEESKTPETRARRIDKIISALQS